MGSGRFFQAGRIHEAPTFDQWNHLGVIRMPEVPDRFTTLPGGFKSFLAPAPEGVIRWTVGEPGFDTPQPIVEAAIAALNAGQTKYTRPEGTIELCRASANRLRTNYGIPATPETVIITPGAKQALLYSMMVTASPGDEVLLLAPAWPSYDIQCRLLGLVPVHVPVRPDAFHPDFEALEAAVTEKTRALVINSPNNPTGAVYTPDEIQRLLDFATRHDLWLVSDEIYARLNWTDWDHISPASLPGGAERTIVVSGWSKSFAMTGWRLGVVWGPPSVIEAMGKLQANACSHVPTFLMDAALAALKPEIDEAVERFNQAYISRRAKLMAGIGAIPSLRMAEPEGAFYGFVDITATGMDSRTFATRCLDEARVQLIPGGLLPGGEGYIRISYACDEESIDEGLLRITRWIDSL
jgi:aspartate/methionine/tyrosine aminotransferase